MKNEETEQSKWDIRTNCRNKQDEPKSVKVKVSKFPGGRVPIPETMTRDNAVYILCVKRKRVKMALP